MRMPVAELRHVIDPVEEVRAAIDAGWLLAEPIVMRRIDESSDALRIRHICRVAFFVVHGWSGALILDGLRLCDGQHRLAAAIVRGDVTVEVNAVAPPSSRQPTSSPTGSSSEDRAPESV